MILILGGTTEGRLAVRVADAAGSPYWYSTRGEMQQIECKNGTHISGALDFDSMSRFCADNGIRLLIDAAHPFAEQLHITVASVAESLDIPAVRLERIYPGRDNSIIWCESYDDAVRRLEADGIGCLLAMTGVQTISKLENYWKKHNCYFRILHRDDSRAKAIDQGFDPEKLVYYEEENSSALISRLHPDAILTKESGESGGFTEKTEAARLAGIPVYAVKRPELPAIFETVTGEHGLRKAIEKLVPGFFALRSGFTTGACATAAAKAALMALLGQNPVESIEIAFPDGERLKLPINSVRTGGGKAVASVIKDAGDDPDITNGVEIVATVSLSENPGVHFLQGEGVGRVTLPGLGLEIGGPAINRVPRQMMTNELSAIYPGGLDVTISVPRGRELALKTFNPKLGVVDGISIIGTSGIVRPFSSEAFVDTIRKEIQVAKALGVEMLIINSGARSKAALQRRFPDAPPQAFIHYGNYIGDTLRIAAEESVKKVTMGIMLGKAVKLAEGNLDTHSRNVLMNKDFLKTLVSEAGCSEDALSAIDNMTLARELWKSLSKADLQRFCKALLQRCQRSCEKVYPASAGSLTVLLLDEDGNVAGL